MTAASATSRYSLLENSTRRLCDAFAASASLEKIQPLFVSKPTIIEHGPSAPSVPFLSTFTGSDALKQYMSILAETLKVSDATFSRPTVDTVQWVVSVKGKGHFTWISGKGEGIDWDEEFVYVLSEFDEEGKIGKWEVWADPLNAWMASQGKRLGA